MQDSMKRSIEFQKWYAEMWDNLDEEQKLSIIKHGFTEWISQA